MQYPRHRSPSMHYSVFKAKFLVLMDTFETRDFIFSQIACTSKQQCIHAASHALDLYSWFSDFALYFQYCFMD